MKKKNIILIVLVVVIGSFVGLGLAFGNKGTEDVTYITSAVVKSEDLTAFVNTSGMVSSKASYDISPKQTGEVVAIHVKDGDKVIKGQLLAELDRNSIEKQIVESEIQLEIARETLLQIINQGSNNYKTPYKNAVLSKDTALKAYEDAKKLNAAGVGTKASVDSAYSTYKQALNSFEDARANYNNENSDSDIKIQELRLKSLENSLLTLKEQLEETYIKSPIDGVVTSDDIKLLSIVGQSSTVFTIEDLNQLVVNINVSQYDIHRLEIGQKAVIKADGLEDESFEGKVSKIGTKAISKNLGASQEMVIEVEIDIVSENTALKPNYSVKAEVETAHVENALVLPYESVYVNKEGDKVVFTVNEGVVSQHIIERGVEGMFNFQAITETIKVDDHVILNPNEAITEESNVVETEVKE